MNDDRRRGKQGQPGQAGTGRTGGAGGAGGAGGEGGDEGGVGGAGGVGGGVDAQGMPIQIVEPGPLGRYTKTQVFLLIVIAGELALLIARV